MAVTLDKTITRDSTNTIDANTPYYELNTKAGKIVDDIVGHVEEQLEVVEDAVNDYTQIASDTLLDSVPRKWVAITNSSNEELKWYKICSIAGAQNTQCRIDFQGTNSYASGAKNYPGSISLEIQNGDDPDNNLGVDIFQYGKCLFGCRVVKTSDAYHWDVYVQVGTFVGLVCSAIGNTVITTYTDTYNSIDTPANSVDKNSHINTIWHSGNDGDGSGLDANYLRGMGPDTLLSSYMQRAFFIDAADGDDANDGSIGAPLKSIKKACDLLASGGRATLYLLNNAEHIINSEIDNRRKNILLTTKDVIGDGSHAVIKPSVFIVNEDDKTVGIRRIILKDSVFGLYKIDPILPAVPDGYTPNFGAGYQNLFDMGGSTMTGINGLILNRANTQIPTTNDQGKQFFLAGGKYWDHSGVLSISQYVCHHKIGDSNIKLFYLYKQVCAFVTSSSEMTDIDGNTSYDFFAGIVYDADGKPRNVISNQIF